jgi:uncharacterized protein YbjT (DUF2867 family)
MKMRTGLTVLVVGATGSIGRLVVEQAVARGHTVRALVRASALDAAAVQHFDPTAHRVVGDLTRVDTLADAVTGIDAVVFAHGSSGSGKAEAELVDYGAVRNVLAALNGRRDVRIALMTSIGVTNRTGAYNRSTEIHDWKRRGERLVRAGGLPYTIVRPGWFDYNAADQLKLHFLQGDTRQAGDPSDGAVSRRQIAQVLVASLGCESARGKTLELMAERGPAQGDLEPMFAALTADAPSEANGFDAIGDMANMPIEQEPQRVRETLRDAMAPSAGRTPRIVPTLPTRTQGAHS